MKIRTCIKRGLFLTLAVGFLLTGKELTVKAADKVEVSAQVFKDKKVLNEVKKFDKNQDGYLDGEEIASITSIGIYESVSDLSGLEYLENLESVHLIYSGKSIQLGDNVKDVWIDTNTKSININASGVEKMKLYTYWGSSGAKKCEKVDVSKCTELKDLYVGTYGTTSIQFPKNGGDIEKLSISGSDYTVLKMPIAKKLTSFTVYGNHQLTTLDTQNIPNLEILYVEQNDKLCDLNIKRNYNLKKLVCSNNKISKLDVSGNSKLDFLSCPYNQLTSLDCSKNRKLTALQCYENKISSLNLKKTTALQNIYCESNKLKSLDLSQNIKLDTVSCYNNPLDNLYIKGKENAIKKVKITPVIASAKAYIDTDEDRRGIVVNIKENKKIKSYVVIASAGGDWFFKKTQEDLKFDFDNTGCSRFSIKAVSGVEYKGVVVYAQEVTYKKKVIVK